MATSTQLGVAGKATFTIPDNSGCRQVTVNGVSVPFMQSQNDTYVTLKDAPAAGATVVFTYSYPTDLPSYAAAVISTPSGGLALSLPDSSQYPLTGTLLAVTTLFCAANTAALTNAAVIPFDSKLRDDLTVGDVTTNIGRIAIPAAAKAMRLVSGVSCVVSEGGTYRRTLPSVVMNGTALTSVTAPTIYQAFRGVTVPVIGAQTPMVLNVSSLIDVSAWTPPATPGASYVELKLQHDGTAGTGAQATVSAGAFFSVEFYI